MFPPPISIHPVLACDYVSVAHLEAVAFSSDPISVYGFGPAQDAPAAIARRVQSLAAPPPDCVVRMRKAATTDGRIVGFAYWKFYYEPRIVPPEREKSLFAWPEGANPELCEAVFARADRIRDAALGGKRYAGMLRLLDQSWACGGFLFFFQILIFALALNVLVVSPEYQRRGIGALLIHEGLEEADKNNLPVWLGASEPALKLYKRVGFQADEVIEVDMRKYGGNTIETHTSMTRPAVRS
jgi:GNAT superfamily N-acetyltransferase